MTTRWLIATPTENNTLLARHVWCDGLKATALPKIKQILKRDGYDKAINTLFAHNWHFIETHAFDNCQMTICAVCDFLSRISNRADILAVVPGYGAASKWDDGLFISKDGGKTFRDSAGYDCEGDLIILIESTQITAIIRKS